jgi:cyclic pyranopterin phosphate synthase
MAFLVDIPLCTTEGIPDFNRGYVEKYVHYDTESHARAPGTHVAPASDDGESRRASGKGKGLVMVTRTDLDEARRLKQPACASCRFDRVCEGVWSVYVDHFGWDEMRPVRAGSPGDEAAAPG